MTEELALAWRTPDPARVRALLAAAGLVPAGGDRLLGRGIDLRIERAPAPDRLVALADAEGGPAGAPGTAGDAARARGGAGRLRPAVPRPLGPAVPRLLAVGVATVDLERAAAALGGLAGRLPDDELLGARAGRVADPPIVLLEPAREGRLAATLAHAGEGPAALYLGLDEKPLATVTGRLRARGVAAIAGRGPLGEQLLVRAGPPWAPHVVLVGSRDEPRPSPPGPPSATIGTS